MDQENNNGIETWLDEYDYEQPRKGEIREGVLLELDENQAIVDVGLKHDGIVPRDEIRRLEEQTLERLEPGQEVKARVVRANDQEDSLLLSLSPVRTEKDWNKAEALLESEEVWEGTIVGYNRGGLLVKFGSLQGFIPASHLADGRRHYSSASQRQAHFKQYEGKTLPLKVIEVNRERQRLILSERLAKQELREQNREELLEELTEGQVSQGKVSSLTDFGAFVDLGGADGLVHISELAWRHIRHPREVVQVGDEIDVYVLNLDYKRKRINLSLKRLQPNPWQLVEENYAAGQLVSGKVTNVTDFGAFVLLDVGVEGLVHISELADPEPQDPTEVVQRGDKVVVRILQIDVSRRRIALSLKHVTEQEREQWLALSAAAEEPAEEPEAEAKEQQEPQAEAEPEEEPQAEAEPEEEPQAEAKEQQEPQAEAEPEEEPQAEEPDREE